MDCHEIAVVALEASGRLSSLLHTPYHTRRADGRIAELPNNGTPASPHPRREEAEGPGQCVRKVQPFTGGSTKPT